MKVYLIETSSGSYEDYYTHVKTGFFDKTKAEEYIDKYNKDLEFRISQSEVCNDCTCGKYNYISSVIRNCKLGAKRHNISEVNNLDGDLYFECGKSVYDFSIYEEHKARIKEVDIVE